MIEKSLEILQQTRDGNELDPGDLALLQAAVNDRLTQEGKARFLDLREKVTGGKYARPWLCGVEHVTRDHNNYIYWKGVQIEHFSVHVMKRGELEACTRSLAAHCRHIEALGLPVDGRSYFNSWLGEVTPEFPAAYTHLLLQLPNLYEHKGGSAAFVMRGPKNDDGWPAEVRFLRVREGTVFRERVRLGDSCVEYHGMIALGYEIAQCGQPAHQGPAAASLQGVIQWLRQRSITEELASQLVALDQQNETELTAEEGPRALAA